jgi:myosin heavy subunit
MLAQIRYLGVFQTIQIRRKIFPVRKNHGDFVNVFQQIFSSTKDKSGNEAIKCILNKVQAK